MSFVEEKWQSFQVSGWKLHTFKEKLKLLKVELRKWNREVFGFVDLNIEKIVEDINILDAVAASNNLEDNSRRKELTVQFWQQIQNKESPKTEISSQVDIGRRC